MNGWIKPKDRLPVLHHIHDEEDHDEFADIFDYDLSDPVLVTGTCISDEMEGDPQIYVARYEDDGRGRTSWSTPDCMYDLDVKAWMPCPEKYKEGE